MNENVREKKLGFVFETARAMRFYMDHTVQADPIDFDDPCLELSPIQMKAAMEVWLHQPLSLGRLAAILGVTPPAASAVVEKLVEKDVLTREPDPGDRRRVVIRTHPRTETMFNAYNQKFLVAFRRVADKVGDENVAKWFDVMCQIREILDGETPDE